MVTFENVCTVTYETSSLYQKCASLICLTLLFVSYFLSNYDMAQEQKYLTSLSFDLSSFRPKSSL